MTQTDVATREFEDFERQAGSPAPGAPTADPGAARTDAPLLTLAALVPTLETVKVGDAIYELRALPHYSLGKQTALINARNAQLGLRQREENLEELTPEEDAQQAFYLRRMVAAAIPDAPVDVRDALSMEQMETLVSLFFERSRERRTGLIARAPRPTSAS